MGHFMISLLTLSANCNRRILFMVGALSEMRLSTLEGLPETIQAFYFHLHLSFIMSLKAPFTPFPAAAMEGQEASVVTDYVIKILGLETCADTVVGSEMRRGISGGQKKRVTTGEMLVGPSKAFFMDEISTGLDSSTTYQIIDSLNHAVHILQGTALISLLQPAPETYGLFDDIIVLSDGYIVYQGPRESVVEFFESMGFKCPDRKGVADFLQEVTSKQDKEQYWLHKDEPYRFITAQDFSEAFQAFHVGRRIRDELKTPFDKIKSHPAALTRNKYGVRKMELLKACASREFLLMKKKHILLHLQINSSSIFESGTT